MRTKGVVTTFLFLAFIFILAAALGAVRETRIVDAQKDVTINFLPASGDADCIVLEQGENIILIDTGLAEDAEALIAFLNQKGVKTINYLILTHPDKDHIGGAPAVIKNFKIHEIILPNYNKENKDLVALLETIRQENTNLSYPTRIRQYALGALQLSVYPPLEGHYLNDNNYSLAVLIKHRNVNMLFTGDARTKRITELESIRWPTNLELYKVNYHGRYLESSVAFIKRVKPQIAVITAPKADKEILAACAEVGAHTFFISKDENLVFISDGNTISKQDF